MTTPALRTRPTTDTAPPRPPRRRRSAPPARASPAGASSPQPWRSSSASRSSPGSGRSSSPSSAGTASARRPSPASRTTRTWPPTRARSRPPCTPCCTRSCSSPRPCCSDSPGRRAEPAHPVHRAVPHGDLRAVRGLGRGDGHPDHLPVQPAVRHRQQRAPRAARPAQGWLEDRAEAMVVIVVMSLWGQAAFTTVIYLAALQDVPGDVLEAARIDGANNWQTFWRVVWPQLRPSRVRGIYRRGSDPAGRAALRPRLRHHPRRTARRDPDDRLLLCGRRPSRTCSSATGPPSPTACFFVTLTATVIVTLVLRRAGRNASR